MAETTEREVLLNVHANTEDALNNIVKLRKALTFVRSFMSVLRVLGATKALSKYGASEEEDKPIDKVFLRGSQMGQIGKGVLIIG